MNDKRGVFREEKWLSNKAFVIAPLVRVLAQVLFSIKITSKKKKKRYLSDILNLTLFSPKETVMLWNNNMSKSNVHKFKLLDDWKALADDAFSL